MAYANSTEIMKLPQYVATEHFTMDDFNAAMSKIEKLASGDTAAGKAQYSKNEVLWSDTTGKGAGATITVDLKNYTQFRIYFLGSIPAKALLCDTSGIFTADCLYSSSASTLEQYVCVGTYDKASTSLAINRCLSYPINTLATNERDIRKIIGVG